MRVLKKEKKLCLCCMEEHEVSLVEVQEENIFKGQKIEYKAVYEYCEIADEYIASAELISQNDIAMKNAYRETVNLLTTNDIINIRSKYHISQLDLATLLGWGGKTITRYEGHHVQDLAHDTILRKLSDDPEWFVYLLEQDKMKFSVSVYERYRDNALKLYESYQDGYLRKSIEAQYAQLNGSLEGCGGKKLDLNKVIDVICYLANSKDVTNLYKVKLMKLLWYVDALAFKRTGMSMMGLAYKALPMGAVPIAHKTLIELKGVMYEEIDFGDAIGYRFVGRPQEKFKYLTEEDVDIINGVIQICGKDTKDQIVRRMHEEIAYVKTPLGEIINYQYTKDLLLD